MQDIIDRAQSLQQRITGIGQQLNISGMQAKVQALEADMAEPDFWHDQIHAQRVSKLVNELRNDIVTWQQLSTELQTITEIAQLNSATPDPEISTELRSQLTKIEQQFERLEFQLLLNGQYDDTNAVVAIHAGAGGVDAQDWAELLLRMVLRYCERRNLQSTIIEVSRGNEAGIKSAVIDVGGRYAYGYLKSEHGVHRLVRQSPFNADALRQTSFALIEVLPELGERNPIVINDDDVRVDVYRSGGHGGQGVNTTDSAVRLTHLPTGIVVTCQNERSQHQNKATAMKILKAKLHQLQLQADQAEKQKIRGEYTSAEWGNQIRSYVLHPYKMVKDHRTDYEVSDPERVLDGDLDGFVEAYLRNTVQAKVSNT